MKCVNHPELDAIIECVRCRRPLCVDCRVPSRDGQTAVCRPCLAAMRQRQAQQQAQPQPMQNIVQPPPQPVKQEHMKFCKHCGGQIPEDAVVCTLCGRQVEQMLQNQPSIVINNENNNTNTNTNTTTVPAVMGNAKKKSTALLLCIFFGYLGAHRFYEGKAATGILWALTGGLFLIGWIIDLLSLLSKPSIYYVK